MLLSAVDIFIESWKKVWEKPWLYYALSAIFVFFALAIFWISFVLIGEPPDAADIKTLEGVIATNQISFWIFLASVTISFFVNLWVTASLIGAVRDHDREVKAGDALSEGGELFISYFWVTILFSVITAVGFILLIIPGIVFTVWFFFAPYILVAEKKGGWSALERSKELVSGRWIAVALRLLLPLAFGLLISAFLLTIVFLFKGIADPDSLNFSLGILASFVLSPFFVMYYYTVYKELVKTKQGEQVVPTETPTEKFQ